MKGENMNVFLSQVHVNDGDQVKAGDPLVVMIAMKMEYVIRSPKDGVVSKVLVNFGVEMKNERGMKEMTVKIN